MQHSVNLPNVISESLDGEVVIIDLGTGTYYNLRGPSARAWDGLAAGWTVDEVAADLARSFCPDGADVAGALDDLLAAVVAAGLLVEGAPAAPGAPPEPVAEPEPWTPLTLETFTDMQDLILLDPVHEVQPEQGWPVALDPDPS